MQRMPQQINGIVTLTLHQPSECFDILLMLRMLMDTDEHVRISISSVKFRLLSLENSYPY